MGALKAVLFDVDGTLCESERYGHRVAANRAFQTVGLDWHWDVDLYGELLKVTGSAERIKHYVDSYRPSYRHIDADLDRLVAAIIKHKTAYYRDIVASGALPLRSGVARVLRELHRNGLRMGIATTTTKENVQVLLQHNIGGDVLNWFEVIAAGDVVPKKKPAPDIYFYVLEKMRLQAAQCVAIEDSKNGVLAARAAGIPVIAVKSEYAHDLHGAQLAVDQWGTPDKPMRTLFGDANGQQMINLKLLQAVQDSAIQSS